MPTIPGNKTIYIQKNDTETWERAIEFCKMHNLSISKFITDALAWYLKALTITD